MHQISLTIFKTTCIPFPPYTPHQTQWSHAPNRYQCPITLLPPPTPQHIFHRLPIIWNVNVQDIDLPSKFIDNNPNYRTSSKCGRQKTLPEVKNIPKPNDALSIKIINK
jgi:hypothetical protein